MRLTQAITYFIHDRLTYRLDSYTLCGSLLGLQLDGLMKIPLDKYLHFAVGAVITLLIGIEHSVMAGVLAAVVAEVCKITMYDMQKALEIDWQEKIDDMLAQILGAAFVACWLLLAGFAW